MTFGMENVYEIDCPENALAKLVDRNIGHFRTLAVSPASLGPHDAVTYWKDEGRTRMKRLLSVAQGVWEPGLPLLRSSAILAMRGTYCQVERATVVKLSELVRVR